MPLNIPKIFISITLALLAQLAMARIIPHLSNNLIIDSKNLGYKIQYRVYLPEGYQNLRDLPVIYMTDGHGYIRKGKMPRLLDQMIKNGEISPVIGVFIDSRSPFDESVNRRKEQYSCNDKYIQFVAQELVSQIDTQYKSSKKAKDRVLLGLSIGGLNAACSGLQSPSVFGGIAMQSPAVHPKPEIIEQFRQSEKLPLKIFLSSGTYRDNIKPSRELYQIFKSKGYSIKYKEVNEKHGWKNWQPLLDDVLSYFFSTKSTKKG